MRFLYQATGLVLHHSKPQPHADIASPWWPYSCINRVLRPASRAPHPAPDQSWGRSAATISESLGLGTPFDHLFGHDWTVPESICLAGHRQHLRDATVSLQSLIQVGTARVTSIVSKPPQSLQSLDLVDHKKMTGSISERPQSFQSLILGDSEKIAGSVSLPHSLQSLHLRNNETITCSASKRPPSLQSRPTTATTLLLRLARGPTLSHRAPGILSASTNISTKRRHLIPVSSAQAWSFPQDAVIAPWCFSAR